MTTEITRKQAILLAVLGVVLVLVLYVQLLIRPALEDASEAKETVENLQTQYEDLVQQGSNYDQNVTSLEGWKEANSEETSRLYPLSEPWRIDRFLNFVIRECGAGITSLSISSTQEYFVDGEGNVVLADPNVMEEAAESTSSEEATAGYTATGEYRCDFTYTMTGEYEDMVQLLRFVDNLSFLSVESYTFNSIDLEDTTEEEGTDNRVEDWYSLTLTIGAYMYADPLAEEDAAETTEAEGEVTDTVGS